MNNKYELKLKLIIIESVITYSAFGFCMPIMTVFWNSIGMNQTLIGLSQMMCSIAILVFNIPMGYIADRFNRKKMNIIGDFGIVITFVIYMLAKRFIVVILAETLCGIFVAMTNGVDNSFVKFYCYKIDKTGELFRKNNAKLSIYQSLGFIIAIFIGMFISKYSLRLPIGLIAIPFIIGTIISIFIDDIGEKIKRSNKEMGKIKLFVFNMKQMLKEKEMRWLVFTWAIVDNISHAIIWVLSPLLIIVGVPVYILGIGWILNYIAPLFGAMVAKKIQNIKLSQKFILPFILVVLGTLPIIIHLNIYTVWLFALTGFANGFHKTFFLPVIQEKSEDKYQTTIISTLTTASKIIYIPIVYIVNYFGNVKPQNALLANLIIFLPFVIINYIKLKQFEKDTIN